MKLNTPSDWSSDGRSSKSAFPFDGGAIATGWTMIIIGVILSAIPFLGFAVYLIGIPLLVVSFVLSIVAMSKGRPIAGSILMLATLIVAPIAFGLLPIISGMAGASMIDEADEVEAASTDPSIQPTAPLVASDKDPQETGQETPLTEIEKLLGEGWVETPPDDTSRDPAPQPHDNPNGAEGGNDSLPDITEENELFIADGGLIASRVWRHKSGREFTASLFSVTTDKGRFQGTFELASGQSFTLPIYSLSNPDIELVRERMSYWKEREGD